MEADILKQKFELIKNNIVPVSFMSSLNETYEWIWLPNSNPTNLLAIRNAEHVRVNMRNSTPISMEAHLDFLRKYNTLQRIDLVLVSKEQNQYVGGINIALTGHGFEIGKYIGNSSYLGKGISYKMSQNFIDFLKKNLNELTEIRAVTKINNFKNINLNFKLGFRIIRRVEENNWLMELK